MIGTLLTFLAVGLGAMILAGVVLWVVGIVFSITIGLASFLMFKVAPYLLLGWVVVKLIEKARGGSSLSAADRRYLEGE
jgi:predicted membrane channel-forming protein YqfA (hemolysin III family)